MATQDDDNDTMIGVGAVGGGALLLWWLLRGRGLGGGASGAPQAAPAVAVVPLAAPASSPCKVIVRDNEIRLNGNAADLPATVAACRAAGSAHLDYAGMTTVGALSNVARALNSAGVAIYAKGDAANVVRDALTGTV